MIINSSLIVRLYKLLIKQGFLVTLFLLCLAPQIALSQYADYDKYNLKRVGPNMRYWHEGLITLTTTIDLDKEESEAGNLSKGYYYGVGLGFSTLLGFDNISQRIGLGLRAEYFPDHFMKVNIIKEFKILVITFMLDFILGDKVYDNHTYLSLFSGLETNMTFDLSSKRKEFHTIFYMLEFQYENLELKWGLQSWTDWFKEGPYFDRAFNIFKLTYKLRVD